MPYVIHNDFEKNMSMLKLYFMKLQKRILSLALYRTQCNCLCNACLLSK